MIIGREPKTIESQVEASRSLTSFDFSISVAQNSNFMTRHVDRRANFCPRYPLLIKQVFN